MLLTSSLALASPVQAANQCETAPAWISTASLPNAARDTLSACFSARSDQAEALLSVSSTRDYAELITLSGRVDFGKSSFAGFVGAGLAALLHGFSSASSEVLVLGPYEHATLSIDRPAPEVPTKTLRLSAALGVPSALAGRVWSFLSAAARRRVVVPHGIKSCLAASLVGSASSAHVAAALLGRTERCVTDATTSGTQPERLLRALAGALLSKGLLIRAAALERREPRAAGVAFTIPRTRAGPVNPKIHVTVADLGDVSDGRATVEHLHASGGTPPYRYYLWSEPGVPPVPSWVDLAPDGTLSLEPPGGTSTDVSLSVYVIDANGYSSQDVP